MHDTFENTHDRSNGHSREPITKALATLNLLSSNKMYRRARTLREPVYTYEDLLSAHDALLLLMYDLRGFSRIKTIGFNTKEDNYINLSKELSAPEVQEMLDVFEITSVLENILIKSLNDLLFEGKLNDQTEQYEIVEYAKKAKLSRPREETELSLEEAAYVVNRILNLRKQKIYFSRILRRFRVGSAVMGFSRYKKPATKIPKLAVSKFFADTYELLDSEEIIVNKISDTDNQI